MVLVRSWTQTVGGDDEVRLRLGAADGARGAGFGRGEVDIAVVLTGIIGEALDASLTVFD